MKKIIIRIAGSILVLGLLLISINRVNAFVPLGPKYTEPVVNPVSGDLDYKVSPSDPVKLPGTQKGTNGLILPVGFVPGEMQFAGKGIILSDFSGGSVRACFSFPLYQYDWAGSVYQWNGTKWVKLVTEIIEPKESAPAWACASLHNDGVYALLMGYQGKPEKQINIEPTFETTEEFLN